MSFRWMFIAAGLYWAASAVFAQGEGGDRNLLESEHLQCLTPSAAERAQLTYPEEAWKRRDGGTVPVTLVFDRPDRGPKVELPPDREAPNDFLLEAVESHVASFRVPCLPRGAAPVRLRMDFVFTPTDGRRVVVTPAVDDGKRQRLSAALACRTHVDGAKRPEYSVAMRKADVEGNVMVRWRLKAADQAPELTILASADRKLSRAVEVYAQGLRMPCFSGEPLTWTTVYNFQFHDGKRVIFDDTNLRRWLAHVKPPLAPADFDLNQMGCPFDLRVHYYQPHRSNRVQQLESADARRQPLMDWIAAQTLNLPSATNTALLGETIQLSVPCGSLKLD